MGLFKFSTDQEDSTTDTRLKAIDSPQSVSDVGQAVGQGFEDIGQLGAGALEYGARKLGMPQTAAKIRSEINRSKDAQQTRAELMSPRGKAAAEAPLISSDTGSTRPGAPAPKKTQTILDDPLLSIGLKSARMAPLVVATAIPGSILSGLGAGTLVVGGATGLAGGALGAGDMVNTVNDEIDKMSHEQLMKESKVYRHAVENGASPDEAKDTIKEIAMDERVPLATLINIGTNIGGPEAMLAHAAGGHLVGKGLVKGALEGIGIGGLTEGIEGATTAYGQQTTAQEFGGKPFDWLAVAKQGIEEGAFGSLFGGAIGGVTNIKGREKPNKGKYMPNTQVEVTSPAGPDAAGTAALAKATGQPSPPVAPPKGLPAAAATPLGPSVVQTPGTEAPPPGAKVQKTKRVYTKPELTAGATPVQAAPVVGPDATQAAVAPPAAPLVRRRAQAEQAAPAPVTPSPVVEPPVQAAQPPAPVQTPPVETPPIQQAPPAPVEQPLPAAPVEQPAPQAPPPLVLGGRPATGRVLPDLAAEARRKAEFEAQAAKPDEVASRGRRYEQTEASITNPVEHAAWRAKMAREAKSANPNPIAVEASKIKSQRGIELKPEEKQYLQDLHQQWLEEQRAKPVPEAAPEEPPRGQRGKIALPGGLEVKDAKQFVLEAARAAQEANANPTVADRLQEFQDILRAAPNREDINQELRDHPFVRQAAVIKDKIAKGTATPEDIKAFEKIEHEFVAPTQEELDKQTEDIEKGSLGSEGLVGEPRAVALADIGGETIAGGAEDAFKKKAKEYTSAGKSVPLTSEAKAAAMALLAQQEAKQKAAAAPKPTKISGPQVKEELPTKVTPPKAEAAKKPVKATKASELKQKRAAKQANSQREIVDRIGGALLDLHRSAQEELKNNGHTPVYVGLQNDAARLEARLKENFGEVEHARVRKLLDAALSVKSREAPRPLTASEAVERIQTIRRENRGYVNGLDGQGKSNSQWGKTVYKGTVGDVFKTLDFNRMVKDFLGLPTPASGGFHAVVNAINKNMVPKILNRTKDVPFIVVAEDDWNRLFPDNTHAAAMYSPAKHQIYMREAEWNGNRSTRDHIILHETVHAAFERSVAYTPGVEDSLVQIMDEARKHLESEFGKDVLEHAGIKYAFSDPQEMVAEIFSNPDVQAWMAQTPISEKLAKQLGVPEFKKYSVWSAVVAFVRRTLGIEPKAHTALEAIMAVTETAAGNYLNKLEPTLASVEDPFYKDLEEGVRNFTEKRVPQNALQPILISAIRRDFGDRVPASKTRSVILNLTTLHQKTQMADRYFPKGLAVKVSDIVEKMRVYRSKLLDTASQKVVTPLHLAQKKYQGSATWETFVNLADRATSANIHPDVPLADPRNAHVKKSFRWRYARQEHAELSKQFQSLPQDLKDVWHAARNHLVDMQNEIAYKNLENIVEASLGRLDEQLTRRIHNGTMSEADRELFKTNKAMRAIANAQELKKIKGVYFPKMRRGDYVITGEYQLPAWEKYLARDVKTNEEDGRYVFQDKATADAFLDDVRKRGLVVTNSRTYSVETATGARKYTYTDPITGVLHKTPQGLPKEYFFSRGDTGTHEVFEHVVQKKLVDFFESEKAAREAERNYREDANYKVNGYEPKEKLAVRTSKVTSRQIKSALKSMEQSADWKKMSDAQKKALEQSFMEMSLSFVSSTSPQNRARPRRNVLGASKDMPRNIAEYSAAASGTLSTLTHMPELEKAFDALDQHREEFRHQAGNVTAPRAQILDSMRDSAYADDYATPNKRNRLVNGLLALSFMDKLVSPAYHMINGLQPWMVSVPVLGGRHGFAKTTYELGRAYNSMGFIDTLKSGAKDTKKALFDLMEGTTDYMADIRKRLAKQADGAELADMLDYLHEHGWIDKDSGLEVAELINAGSKAEHILHRVDHVVRQFGTAVEVVNRATTAIAAYRMERARGASVEDARLYAQESVANTQGGYSTSNAPKLFKHPLGRVVLQFKKFAQLQYFLLSKLAYNAFKGATSQERAEAAKGLAGLLVAYAAMAGATGLPTEPIKVPWMLLSMFLPMPSWEEVEQGATEYAQQYLGDNLGDAVTHGLPRLAGVDFNSRVGANSLLFFGEPKSDKENDVKAWLLDTVLGAPFGLGVERIQGVRSFLAGDFGDAAEKLVPFKFLADSVKAYRTATEGKFNKRGEQVAKPGSYAGAAMQAIGFKPASEARRQEATSAYYHQSGRRKAERQALLDEFVSTKDRASVRRKILRYNVGKPKEARITMKSLEQLLKRKASDKKKGYVKHGTYGGKLNKDLLDKYIGE